MSEPIITEPGSIEQALRSAFQASRERARQQRRSRFDPPALAWLALVPAWTEPLASACSFPTTSVPFEEFPAQAQAAGLCVRSTSTEPDGTQTQHFWMSESMRAQVLDDLREQQGVSFLQEQVVEVGQRLRRAQEERLSLSPIMAHWAELAVQTKGGLHVAAQGLIKQIQELLKKNDTGEALAWVRVATVLAEALGGELDSAVQIAHHQIELAYRRAHDERRLKHYLEREEQTADFLRLVETTNADAPWALHYIGMGGVGKTMLLRYITSHLAYERKWPTSRVDFDYLSPDYPVREPGQLLLELADELQSYGSTDRQEYMFNELQSRIAELHEVLSGQTSGNPLAFLEHWAFDKVLRTFADLVRSLPQPVILILDTCEELAKAQSAATMLPNVEATFNILERLHQEVPTVRVIFAGRRLLARSGCGWKAEVAGLPEAKPYLPEKKDYLLLHEIRGFDEREADEFFGQYENLKLGAELRRAILNRSQETGTVAEFHWDDGRSSEKKTRYNPFDLSLYADWVREDPALDANTIASGETDPYVELRILGRIKREDILKLLPAVVWLRRFEKPMLRPALDTSDETFEEVYRELGDQEWIDYQRDERLQTIFLEVDRSLHPRLLKYYQHEDRRTLLDDAKPCLGPPLAALVRERELGRLSVDHLDAALRSLPPPEAATWWEEVERRIPTQADWNWAQRVTGFMLGEEGAVAQLDHPLRAAVRATWTSASIQTSPTYNASADWQEVAQTAKSYPDPTMARLLAVRALAGQIAATRVANQRPPDDQLSAFWQMWTEILEGKSEVVDEVRQGRAEQLAASLCAVLEVLLDRAELTGDAVLVPDPVQITEWVEWLDREATSHDLLAFACTLTGRTLALRQQWEQAAVWLERAEAALPSGKASSQPTRWFDWRAPASLRARVRLERLRMLSLVGEVPGQARLMAWQHEAAGRLEIIDAERLVSLILTVRLTKGLILTGELASLQAAVEYDPDRQPVCAAHRSVPQLFTTLAQGWLALGDGHQALEVLNEWVDEATKAGKDDLSVRAGERTKLQVIRRMRLHTRGRAVTSRLARSNDPEDVALAWPTVAVTAPPPFEAIPQPDESGSPKMIHAWWQCQYMLTPEAARQALEIFAAVGRRAIAEAMKVGDDFMWMSLQLDWEEAMLVAKRAGVPFDRLSLKFDAAAWHKEHPTRSEAALRLMLREFTLLGQGDGKSWPLIQVGGRRAAEAALEEGELLALRLPEQSIRLLDLAHGWFTGADDLVGATLAAIRSTIAAIHAGNGSALYKLEEMVSPSYERLLASEAGSGLPSWSGFVALSDAPEPERLSKLEHPSWAGWLYRLFLLSSIDRVEGSSMWAWVEGRFGQRLPVELALGTSAPMAAEVGSAPSGQPKPPLKARPGVGLRLRLIRFGRKLLLDFLPLVLGLGVGAGVLYGGYLLFGWLLRLGVPAGISTGWQIVLYILTLAFLGRLIKSFSDLRRWIRSLLAARTDINLTIALPFDSQIRSVEPDKSIPMTMQLRQRRLALRWAFPFLIRQSETETSGTGKTPALRPYREAAADVPKEVVEELRRLQEVLRRRRLPVPLQIPPTLVFFPWEAVLTLALPSAAEKEFEEPFQFWRAGEAQPIPSTTQSAWADGEVRVVCSPTWRSLAGTGWKPLPVTVAIHQDLSEVKDSGPLKFLHLVGTPVNTTAGVQFQVMSGRGERRSQEFDIKQSRRSPTRGEVVIRPDKLPVDLVSVVVVQAEPVDSFVRYETDREQAAYLRAFATDVLTAGARVVMVLPALPSVLAEAVLTQLAKGLWGRSEPDVQRLLNVVGQVRRTIVEWKAAPVEEKMGEETADREQGLLAENQIELALDVCLLARQRSDVYESASEFPA